MLSEIEARSSQSVKQVEAVVLKASLPDRILTAVHQLCRFCLFADSLAGIVRVLTLASWRVTFVMADVFLGYHYCIAVERLHRVSSFRPPPFSQQQRTRILFHRQHRYLLDPHLSHLDLHSHIVQLHRPSQGTFPLSCVKSHPNPPNPTFPPWHFQYYPLSCFGLVFFPLFYRFYTFLALRFCVLLLVLPLVLPPVSPLSTDTYAHPRKELSPLCLQIHPLSTPLLVLPPLGL